MSDSSTNHINALFPFVAVLDDMRTRFRDCQAYFEDSVSNPTEYLDSNVLGVPTEREGSVLIQGLPVYRSLFVRNAQAYRARHVSAETVDSMEQ
jgi:hypothetical protein